MEPELVELEQARLTCIDENPFIRILYEKPVLKRGDSIFKRIKSWFKRRDYTNTQFKPMEKRLRNEIPTFITLCDFADFIKILERVYFYHNDLRKATDKTELCTRLLIDKKASSDTKKVIIIEMQREDTTITLTMHRDHDYISGGFEDVIDVRVYYQYSKESLAFKIYNSGLYSPDLNILTSIHDKHLVDNIFNILQNSMTYLFKNYYLSI
jgi:hypothetical protein